MDPAPCLVVPVVVLGWPLTPSPRIRGPLTLCRGAQGGSLFYAFRLLLVARDAVTCSLPLLTLCHEQRDALVGEGCVNISSVVSSSSLSS